MRRFYRAKPATEQKRSGCEVGARRSWARKQSETKCLRTGLECDDFIGRSPRPSRSEADARLEHGTVNTRLERGAETQNERSDFMKNKLKEFLMSNWTLTEKCLLLADVLLAGILVGWLTTPLRRVGGFFSNNKIDITPDYDYEEEEM